VEYRACCCTIRRDAPFLQNVAPHLWRLLDGLVPVEGEADEDYVMPNSRVALIGREIASARRTVLHAQARSLRNIDLHPRWYEAVDWMYWLLSSAEVLQVGQIPDLHYDFFMSLCRACRLLLRPAGLTPAELIAVDTDLKRFVRGYYAHGAKKRPHSEERNGDVTNGVPSPEYGQIKWFSASPRTSSRKGFPSDTCVSFQILAKAF